MEFAEELQAMKEKRNKWNKEGMMGIESRMSISPELNSLSIDGDRVEEGFIAQRDRRRGITTGSPFPKESFIYFQFRKFKMGLLCSTCKYTASER